MTRVLLAGSFLLALAPFVSLAPTAAGAQTLVSSCPTSGLSLSRVEITSPKSGSTLSAGSQRVTGKVVSGLNRAELYVDGVLSDARQLGEGQEDFDLGWQAVATLPRSVTLSVVACGTGLGQLLRGTAEITVRLTPVETTRPGPASTVVGSTSTVRPASTLPGQTTLAGVAAGPAAATAGSSTSTTATVPTTVPLPVQPPVSGPPGTTATRAANEPLVLGERPKESKPGPPLWVGAVVGLSGTIGLALSAAFSRRSAAKAAQQQLPVDDPHDEGSDLISL